MVLSVESENAAADAEVATSQGDHDLSNSTITRTSESSPAANFLSQQNNAALNQGEAVSFAANAVVAKGSAETVQSLLTAYYTTNAAIGSMAATMSGAARAGVSELQKLQELEALRRSTENLSGSTGSLREQFENLKESFTYNDTKESDKENNNQEPGSERLTAGQYMMQLFNQRMPDFGDYFRRAFENIWEFFR